jgi:hypothetical protein
MSAIGFTFVNAGHLKRRDTTRFPHARFPHQSRCANADIAVLELRDGNFELTDSEGSTVPAKRRLLAQMTLRRPRLVRAAGGVVRRLDWGPVRPPRRYPLHWRATLEYNQSFSDRTALRPGDTKREHCDVL